MAYGIEQFKIIMETAKNGEMSALAEAMIWLAQSIQGDFDKMEREIKGLEQQIRSLESKVRNR